MQNSYNKIRHNAGLVELKNWVRIDVSGPAAAAALDSIVGCNILDVFNGTAINTLIPSLSGGVDAIIWVLAKEDGYQIVAEPEETNVINGILNELVKTFDITITDLNSTHFHLLLAGPEAEEIAIKALGEDITSIAFLSAYMMPKEILATRIGYIGEYELHLFGTLQKKEDLIATLQEQTNDDLITDTNAFPILMAEMRTLNRVRDIPDTASVFEAGLQWMIDFQKDTLRAAEALAIRRDKINKSCVLMVAENGQISNNVDLLVEGINIGNIQTAYFSDTLRKTIALTFINHDLAVPGLTLNTSVGICRTVSAPAFLSKSVLNSLGQVV